MADKAAGSKHGGRKIFRFFSVKKKEGKEKKKDKKPKSQQQSDLSFASPFEDELEQMRRAMRGKSPSQKVKVGIFSRTAESEYQWLKANLESASFVRSVQPCYISNTGFREFSNNVSRCDFGILYHTQNSGRVNLTDVTASLYDEELQYMSEKLGSFLPLDVPVERLREYDDLVDKVEETDLAPNHTDLTVPVFVHRGGLHFSKIDPEINPFLRDCRTMTGLTPIVIITHMNNPSVKEIERQFRLAGAEHVLLVENYTREDHLRTLGRDTAILTFLYTALQDVTFRMSERRNVIRERAERKKFLIKYMHHAVLEREIQKLRRPR